MIQPDEIIRSSRKTLSLCIDGHGRLIVRAPKLCKEERIFAFIKEKEGWILKKQAEKRERAIPLPPENLDGYAFLLLGREVKIKLGDHSKVGYDSENATVYLPKKRSREKLVAWLKENALRILTTVSTRQAERMQTSFKSVSVGSAKSRWGTCSADNEIRYTFRLLYCPKEVVEYVVIHELAHVRHKNHSKRFWQEVEKYCPDWRKKRKWLKERGQLMEIF